MFFRQSKLLRVFVMKENFENMVDLVSRRREIRAVAASTQVVEVRRMRTFLSRWCLRSGQLIQSYRREAKNMPQLRCQRDHDS